MKPETHLKYQDMSRFITCPQYNLRQPRADYF